MGLAIGRSIVNQHGGRLIAASGGKGRGATFTVMIPALSNPPTMEVSDEKSAPRQVGPVRTLTILLVEDNLDTLNYLSRMPTLRGHVVRTAADLATALRAAETGFDLLISDIELPDGTGLQLMESLRSTRLVPGIALSGFGSSDDFELSRAAGFAIHLKKPVEFHRLEEAIRQLTACSPGR